MSDIKRIGKLSDATVNDVLLFAVAHALNKWARVDKGEDNLDMDLLTLIWVSLSKMENIYKSQDELPFNWGNSGLGCVYMDTPISTSGYSSRSSSSSSSTTMDRSLKIFLCRIQSSILPH